MTTVTKPAARALRIEPLTRAAFAPFGEVIEAEAAASVIAINDGTALRYHDLAAVDVAGEGRAAISRVRAEPRALPFEVRMLERHPLGSQAFVPLSPELRYVVVVAARADATPRAFLASHGQGVNYRRGTWHHPLIALDRVSDFIVVDRVGAGANCDELALARVWRIDPL
jgi:ureidoglycolate lyase